MSVDAAPAGDSRAPTAPLSGVAERTVPLVVGAAFDAAVSSTGAGTLAAPPTYVGAGEESHRRETIAAVTAAAAACHHRETIAAATAAAATCHRRNPSIAAAVAAAAAACHHRETSVAVAAAAAACHHRETSGAVASAAADACHRRPRSPRPENHGRRQKHESTGVPPTHTLPAIVSQFYGPCVESRRNGWCFLVSGGSVGGRLRPLFSRHRNVPGAGGE